VATLAKLNNVAGVIDKVQLVGFLRMTATDDMVPLSVSGHSAYPAFTQLVRVS